jgi:hypothetical protein
VLLKNKNKKWVTWNLEKKKKCVYWSLINGLSQMKILTVKKNTKWAISPRDVGNKVKSNKDQ